MKPLTTKPLVIADLRELGTPGVVVELSPPEADALGADVPLDGDTSASHFGDDE